MQQVVMSTVARSKGQQRKRVAILGAAREEFLLCGFEAAGVDSIAARAGVSKQTLYNHFGSKEALFSQVVDLVVEGVHERLSGSDSAVASVIEAAETLADFLMLDETVSLYRLALLENERHPDLARQLNERAERPLVERVKLAIRQSGVENKSEVDAIAAGIVGGVKHVTLWPRLTGSPAGTPDPRTVASTVITLVSTLTR
jgi:TetR/AcrR family transcriptional regulator of autoinduction and epiphytic fitness